MIKNLWSKIFKNVAGGQNNSQLTKLLLTDLEQLNNESLKRNYKNILKSKVDVLETSQEHHKKFLEALGEVKECLVLLSNWTKFYEMSDDFENSLRSCLTRGVNVYVGFAFKQLADDKATFDSELKADNKYKELQDWCFKNLGQGCRLHKIERSSLKITLIVDDKYLINGNCEKENRSWVFYDKNFVNSERDSIIGNLDGPLEITRRGLFRRVVPGSFD